MNDVQRGFALGERLDAPPVVFSLAVIAAVYVGKHMPVAQA